MENNRVMQRSSSFWFRLATILTAVVLGLLSASAVQAEWSEKCRTKS